MPKRNRIVVVWSIIAVLGATSGAAHAAEDLSGGRMESNEKRCHRYAETGVRQQMNNLRDQCGIQGGEWHTDYADHYTWCLTAPPEEPASENSKRNELLDQCQPAAAADQRCHDYARTGVKQAQDNFRFECGHRGGAWHHNYMAHHDWCETVDEARTDEEIAMRADLLASCR
ncbi:MAG: hypothetical protein AAGE01_20870 [Pseudomonadota bacterium]